MKRSKIIAAAVLAVLAAAWAFGFWRINRMFPALQIVEIQPGETFTLHGWEITVGESQIVPLPQLLEEYPDIDLALYEDPYSGNKVEEYKIMLVPVTVKNVAAGQGKFPVYYLPIVSGAYHTAINPFTFTAMNPSYAKLDTGETATYLLNFRIHPDLFVSKSKWNRVEDRQYCLEIMEAPFWYRFLIS